MLLIVGATAQGATSKEGNMVQKARREAIDWLTGDNQPLLADHSNKLKLHNFFFFKWSNLIPDIKYARGMLLQLHISEGIHCLASR